MKRLLIYCFVIATLISGCEDIYTPDIDDVSDAIVVDARIVKGRTDNYIRLTKSQGFNDEINGYPAATDGKVFLIDNVGNETELPEVNDGEFYVSTNLVSEQEYKIKIEYGSNIFESEFEKVPPVPTLDSVYGIPEVKVLIVAGANDADDFKEVQGVQMYADMKSTPEISNYHFTAEKVLEYVWYETVGMNQILHYYWKKSTAGGVLNIAAPPEYSSSKDIKKHPLFFFNKSVSMEGDNIMMGWIMVLHQHAISESAYKYYKDLNAQLDSEGRIFDPVYVQARSNIKCTSNSKELVLGNFEISNEVEHRYFIRFISEKSGYKIQESFDRSPIPWRGETIDVPPPFWVQ